MSNIPGLYIENIFLVILSYILILVVNRTTKSESAVLLYALLTFHHIVAYLYAFFLSTPQNEVDQASFVKLAIECTELNYCGYFSEYLYANFLAKALAVGQSIYFVFLLNILLFVISLYFFIGISEIFFSEDYRKINIFLYSMWPSVVYFTTLNYRETFELYLLIAAVYFGLTGSKSDSLLRMLACMFLLLAMGLFHMKGLLFLSPVLFLIIVSYKLPMTVSSLGKKLFLISLMSAAVYVSQSMYSDYLHEWHSKKEVQAEKTISGNAAASTADHAGKTKVKTQSDNALLFVKNREIYLSNKKYPDSIPSYVERFMRKVAFYRASLSWVKVPQTALLTTISDKSVPAFIATYFIAYLDYLFSPFFFQVNSFLGLLAYVESVLRVILLSSSLVLIKRYPQVRVLFAVYLAVTAMWAIGVVSYGAAIRHHIQSNWILVLLGVPVLSGFMSERINIYKKRKRLISRGEY